MKSSIKLSLSLIASLFICISSLAINTGTSLKLKEGNFQLIVSGDEAAPVRLAVETLAKDFEKVMHYKPEISHVADNAKGIDIVIVNETKGGETLKSGFLRPLDGFESHRVYGSPDEKRIYLHGEDMRGAIYAIYSFSEQFLDVPPLWYFSSWEPSYKKKVEISSDFDYFRKSPQVRYRAWFPNDTDLFAPWRQLSQENNELWLETMLRLKLNTVELEATVTYPNYKLNSQAALLRKYGLVLTSHHHVACNNNLMNWEGYWRKVRGIEPPRLLLSDEESLREFWQYSIETVCRDKQENLWQIAFRGINDQPFWAAFSDAPADDKQRAEVINRMIRIQLEMIKKATGEEDPFVRMTFYDELSDLLAKGYLKPPTGKNMLWTFVAGRRDHYPYDDLVAFDATKQVKLGYYMNLQFTSTGAHLAPGEGPWKMEFNYRYVNTRGPLTFSVVNAGNLREFVMEMAANARMMWDMQSYNTDSFLVDFCTQYFGKKHADKIAELYHNYYYAYWQQKPSVFPGLERQFIFHDLRHARVFDQIGKRFNDFSPNPLYEIGFERVPGRSFRIDGDNQVDSLIAGMEKAATRFGEVSRRCQSILKRLPKQNQRFFRDNLAAPCLYMEELSRSLYHFVSAYKEKDASKRIENLDKSIQHLEEARDALYATQEGVFSSWYAGDRLFNIPAKIEMMQKLREKI